MADDFVALFFKLLCQRPFHQVNTFAMALWCICIRRNEKIVGELKVRLSNSLQLA
jgi:hypothetical protein